MKFIKDLANHRFKQRDSGLIFEIQACGNFLITLKRDNPKQTISLQIIHLESQINKENGSWELLPPIEKIILTNPA